NMSLRTRTYAWEIKPDAAPGVIFAPQIFNIGVSRNYQDFFQLTFTITGGTWSGFTDLSIDSDPASTCKVSNVIAPGVDYQASLRPVLTTPTSVTYDVTAVNPGGVPAAGCLFRLNPNTVANTPRARMIFGAGAVGSKIQISANLIDLFGQLD